MQCKVKGELLSPDGRKFGYTGVNKIVTFKRADVASV